MRKHYWKKYVLKTIMVNLDLIGFEQVGNSALTFATQLEVSEIYINMIQNNNISHSKCLTCASIDEKAI